MALDESPVRLMGKTSKANALATGEVEMKVRTITGETVNLAKGSYLAKREHLLRATRKGTPRSWVFD